MTERYINPYTDFGFKSQAEIARFTPQDAKEYEESVKVYRDLTNVVNTAERKGREEGRAEGLAEGREEEKVATVKRLHAMGLSAEQIAEGTALPVAMVQEILTGVYSSPQH